MMKDVSYVGLKLNKRTDSDILEAIGGAETRQAEIKKLMRVGIKEINNQRAKSEFVSIESN